MWSARIERIDRIVAEEEEEDIVNEVRATTGEDREVGPAVVQDRRETIAIAPEVQSTATDREARSTTTDREVAHAARDCRDCVANGADGAHMDLSRFLRHSTVAP